MQLPTAILVFARSAAEESHYKRLCADPERNERALALLNRRILRVTRATGHAVFHLTEREQRGDNFGERISNAAADIFAKGYERLIIVGNDCPALSPEQLYRAETLLRAGLSVLGPDYRGGAYLIGLHRATFQADSFRQLPWQTDRLLGALRVHLVQTATLRIRPDLNERSDLGRLRSIKRTGGREIAQILQLLRCSEGRSHAVLRPILSSPVSGLRFDRGPPFLTDCYA